MIDLDDQLAAYDTYLNTLERQIVVLRPQLKAPDLRPYRRIVAMAAACTLAIVGFLGMGVARLGQSDPSTPSTAQSEPLDWRLVPGTETAFEPLLIPAPAGSTTVTAVVDSSHGLLAVGYETHERQPDDLGNYFVPAVWQSNDGERWRRLEHAASFGEFADNGRMQDVAEYDGQVVAIGEADQGSPQAWSTDNLTDWSRVGLSRPSGYDDNWYTATDTVAAGPQGFVTGGTTYTNHKDDESGESRATMWYSDDGMDWSPVYVEPDGGQDSQVSDMIAVDDGFVAVGTAHEGPAIWTSSDGQSWQRDDVTAGIDGLRFSGLTSIVQQDGEIAAIGLALTSGSTDEAVPAILVSRDGETWQGQAMGLWNDGARQIPVSLIARNGALVGFLVDEAGEDYRVVEYSSDDGVWSSRTIDLPGIPVASTTFDEGVVVITSPPWFYDLEPWTAGSRPTVWIAR